MVPLAAPSSTKAVRLESFRVLTFTTTPVGIRSMTKALGAIRSKYPAADRLFSAIDAMQYNGAPLVEWRGADGRTVDLCR
jgi:hypothetical protein